MYIQLDHVEMLAPFASLSTDSLEYIRLLWFIFPHKTRGQLMCSLLRTWYTGRRKKKHGSDTGSYASTPSTEAQEPSEEQVEQEKWHESLISRLAANVTIEINGERGVDVKRAPLQWQPRL